MNITFKIHYNTSWGQQLLIVGSSPELGRWDYKKALVMNYQAGGFWVCEINLESNTDQLEYKYILKDEHNNFLQEEGKSRVIKLAEIPYKTAFIHDSWQNISNTDRALKSSAFSQVIMRRPATVYPYMLNSYQSQIQLRVNIARIGKKHKPFIIGNQEYLGNWVLDKNKPLKELNNSEWYINLDASKIKFPFEYKYGIETTTEKNKHIIETGKNRTIHNPSIDAKTYFYKKNDGQFNDPLEKWRGAGVSIPVFSLRSERGFGIGEFIDLKEFIDWAKKVDLKMIQILPINETIASHNWLDSYPYKAISVMALHPMYLNIEKMGTMKDPHLQQLYKVKQKELNAFPVSHYVEVLKLKSRFYKQLFDQDKHEFIKDKDYLDFYAKNKDWLIPYAAFVYLRDKMGTADFQQWGNYSIYDERLIIDLCKPESETWDDIAIHYYIQYHLHKQLTEVADYARENGIVLKGDIPIGISPQSVEAWTEPHLFNLDAQAGAPPDDFAIEGQNWGFPTYNWDIMAKDDFLWWKKRLQKMSEYFDSYRIDHILGFFRIWEIPMDALSGILGYFKPSLALTPSEINNFGIEFDENRFSKSYIKGHFLPHIFGEFTDEVRATFLQSNGFDSYELKIPFNTQRKVNNFFLKEKTLEELSEKEIKIRDGLFKLIAEVLFIKYPHSNEDVWVPRISLHQTHSYNELDEWTKEKLNQLYIHFFYKKHDDFWHKEALKRLPALLRATEMLVCGEDLGMIPACVPPVMNQLGILSLEIQRMPKNPHVVFAHPNDAPYLSVCTTSTHDMTTIRGWWEENAENTQRFYNIELGNYGTPPYYAEPWICRQIIDQHLYSPAMWTTFPIQDLLSMDGHLRWEETKNERINIPSNVRHRWRFRMTQSLDDLLNAKDFNAMLKEMINQSGRNPEL